MLTELHIRNFALIDELTIEVGPGFSVLTGETGAGKSIIVDAMSAALGERTGSEVVRTGTEKCLLEAVFDVSRQPAVSEAAIAFGFEPEGGTLILSREIASGGRSQCRINGRPVTSSVLREITSRLVDLHGQHEHQSLLSVAGHIDVFDAWRGGEVSALRDQARGFHAELTSIIGERDRLRTDEHERARLLDLYNFQLDEIKAANLRPDEEDELAAERNRLANAEKLHAAATEIHGALGTDGAAVDGLGAAAAAADRIAQLDPSATQFAESINAALIGAQEALIAVRDYQDGVEANPSSLEHVEDRLDHIRALKRKYGDTIEEVIRHGDDLAGKIDELAHSEERSQELNARIEDIESRLGAVSEKLTALRRSAAPAFEKAVEEELADLAMEKTRFEVSIWPIEPGPTGADAVEFLISPNPGEPVKPLAKIASGGEMSRIMLALKTAFRHSEAHRHSERSEESRGKILRAAQNDREILRSAQNDVDVPTLVFDEIDTGIGGLTAQVLGDKLAALAKSCQVMCVTHLPQVASKASRHFSVEKVVRNGRSSVNIQELEGEARVRELARMLGGEEGSGAAALHAREMLSLADQRNR